MSERNYDAVLLEQRLIGSSRVMRELRRVIAQLARSNLPVLIQGPRGAGKELVAEALHDLSGRQGKFVPFNVCAIPDTMFEDSLFGHVRGSFTGANTDSPGYLAEADRGTVFLDEIGGLPIASQRKLLRAIETKVFRPVGARSDRRSDFRLVAASNDDLRRLAADGAFRDDLIDRLGAAVIVVPSLADHMDDVEALASHLLGATDPTGRFVMSASAIRELSRHGWPGNVRELRNVIARAVALTHDSTIEGEDIRGAIAHGRYFVSELPAINDEHVQERELLVAILKEAAWDTDVVAHQLGVARSTVYRRMERLGINVARGPGQVVTDTASTRIRAVS